MAGKMAGALALSRPMDCVARSSVRISTNANLPCGSRFTLMTAGGEPGCSDDIAELNRSVRICALTTPMVRLPTYTCRGTVLLGARQGRQQGRRAASGEERPR